LRHYELVVVLSPMLNQEQTSETWDRIKGFINTREGEITYEEHWGTRRLAYSIKRGPYHFQEGSYHLNRFRTESPFNIELETFLRTDEQVLRSMVIATDTPLPPPGSASPGIARPAPIAAAAPAPAATPAAEGETPAVEAPLPRERPRRLKRPLPRGRPRRQKHLRPGQKRLLRRKSQRPRQKRR